MKNRILLIGNICSSYVQQYIENVLCPLQFNIYMQISESDVANNIDFIKKNQINIIKLSNKKKLMYKIPYFGNKLYTIINLLLLSKGKPFDFIHVQFVTRYDLRRVSFVKGIKTKCYASFWGSDLLRFSNDELLKEKQYLSGYNYISTAALVLQKKLEVIFPEFKKKSEVIPFGVSLLGYIDKYDDDKMACKESFMLPTSKKIIAIGYNAIREQQHDKVINALKKIKNKNDYHLIFQMSYGYNNEDYVNILKQLIEISGFEYTIISNYLTLDNLAKLRIATDIFINAQTTDAFANSVIENIYAKTQIINASWLHYPEIEEFSLKFSEFNEFDEIPNLINQTISDDKLEWNKNKIKEISTWDSCRNKWAEIYDEII